MVEELKKTLAQKELLLKQIETNYYQLHGQVTLLKELIAKEEQPK